MLEEEQGPTFEELLEQFKGEDDNSIKNEQEYLVLLNEIINRLRQNKDVKATEIAQFAEPQILKRIKVILNSLVY